MKTVIKGVRGSISYYVDHLLPIIEEIDGIDLFVGGGVDFTGFTVAEFLKVRYVYVAYFPQMFRSAYYPPVSLPLRGLPRVGNRVLWALESWLIHHAIGLLKIYNLKRKEMGLPPILNIIRSMTASAIMAADRELITFPPDVPGHVQTGSLHESDPTPLPERVTEFLRAGAPPVFIGFGSMEITDPEKTEGILFEVIRSSDQRFIVSDRLIREGANLPENLLVAGYVSFDLLFPHLDAVVHHGGAGTTQIAARYGVPQLILPKAFDQFYWAERIRVLGLGPRGFPMNRLTAKKLAAALSALTSNPDLKENAVRVREQIPKHDGNSLTVAYLVGEEGTK
jgi:vancomycin aglycone glucosyltransferase